MAGLEFQIDYVEEAINKKEPLLKVLRILALYSLTNNGIKQKQLEFLKREIAEVDIIQFNVQLLIWLQTYGFQHLLTLNNLEKLGIIKKQEGKNSYPILKKSFSLIVEEIDENNPTDFAYVYSGYISKICLLVN